MILWLPVKIFTDSFGIKVYTFHLYHLKIKERQSSSHLTSHNTPQGKEKERGGRKDQIKSKKEERSIHETKSCLKFFLLSGFVNCPNDCLKVKSCLKFFLLSGFVNCPNDCLKVFVFLGQMECRNGQISSLIRFHGPIWKVFWGRRPKLNFRDKILDFYVDIHTRIWFFKILEGDGPPQPIHRSVTA